MNRIIAISLSLLILSFAIKDLIIYAHFQLNRAYIEQQFCINKNRPEMNCHGSCFLNKTLKESKDQETKCPVSDKKEKTNTVYLFDISITPSVVTTSTTSVLFQEYQNGYRYLHCSNTFHPPELI